MLLPSLQLIAAVQTEKGAFIICGSAQVPLNQGALQYNRICVCASKASPADRLIECHSPECSNGKFFHLACLGLNAK